MFQIAMRVHPSTHASIDRVPVGSCVLRGRKAGATWSFPLGAAGDAGASTRTRLASSAFVLAARFDM